MWFSFEARVGLSAGKTPPSTLDPFCLHLVCVGKKGQATSTWLLQTCSASSIPPGGQPEFDSEKEEFCATLIIR